MCEIGDSIDPPSRVKALERRLIDTPAGVAIHEAA
jgi:hypothetical protein